MNSQLQTTLQSYVQSGWQANPATHQIISGYARYHAVLAIVGAVFMFIVLWLSIRFWIEFKKVPKISRLTWSFQKKTHFCFATLYTLVILFLALIVAANVSTAANPLPGFKGSITSISDNSYNKRLHSAFNDWIVSGKSAQPALVQQRIHERRVFHTVRLVISSILLVGFSALSVYIWKWLISERYSTDAKWSIKEVVWLVVGIVSVVVALLLMIIVMANAQSAIYPIANTLQFG